MKQSSKARMLRQRLRPTMVGTLFWVKEAPDSVKEILKLGTDPES
jgi:hypothetical protein